MKYKVPIKITLSINATDYREARYYAACFGAISNMNSNSIVGVRGFEVGEPELLGKDPDEKAIQSPRKKKRTTRPRTTHAGDPNTTTSDCGPEG